MFSSRSAFQRFADIVSGPEGEIRLAEAALVISSEFRRDFSVGDYLHWLDGVQKGAPRGSDLRAAALYFVEELGFSGDTADCYDPRNSLLDQVIDRRIGIPITLSILMMEVLSQSDIAMEGVGFPGHFMVRDMRSGRFLDPFAGPDVLDETQARARVLEMAGKARWQRSWDKATAPRQILFRLLTNLKLSLLDRQDYGHAAAVQEKLLVLAPGRPQEYRDLGVVAASAGDWAMARRFLQEYLEMKPDAADAGLVRIQLQHLVDEIARRN